MEAYPGHDLIDWNNLEVNGAIDVSLIPGRGWHLIEAGFLNNTTFYKFNGDWYTYDQLQALPNSGINFIGGFLYGPDGTLLPDAQGGFTYRGQTFVNEELIEIDGVLFASSTEFGLIPVGLSFGTMLDLVGEVGGELMFRRRHADPIARGILEADRIRSFPATPSSPTTPPAPSSLAV